MNKVDCGLFLIGIGMTWQLWYGINETARLTYLGPIKVIDR